MDKCFCHLNGLAVKDAVARKDLQNFKSETQTNFENTSKEFEAFKSMLSKSEQNIVEKVENVENTIIELSNTVESAGNNITQNSNRITDLESESANGQTIFISDSYGVESVTGATNWIDSVASYLGLSENDFYASRHGSRGFAPNSMVTETFLDSLKEFDAVVDRNKIKRIVVCGGCNDSSIEKNVILVYISQFMEYVKANYPNAKVYIGCIGRFTLTYTSNKNLVNNVLAAYKSSIQYGAYYLNGVEYALRGKDCFIDANHPTAKGNILISEAITNALKTGTANVNRFEIGSIEASGACEEITKLSEVVEILSNGKYELTMTAEAYNAQIGFVIKDDAPLTLTTNSLPELATFSDNIMHYCSDGGNVFHLVDAELINSVGALKRITGYLVLVGNKLHFRPNLEINSTSWGDSINDIVKITIKSQSITFDATIR